MKFEFDKTEGYYGKKNIETKHKLVNYVAGKLTNILDMIEVNTPNPTVKEKWKKTVSSFKINGGRIWFEFNTDLHLVVAININAEVIDDSEYVPQVTMNFHIDTLNEDVCDGDYVICPRTDILFQANQIENIGLAETVRVSNAIEKMKEFAKKYWDLIYEIEDTEI